MQHAAKLCNGSCQRCGNDFQTVDYDLTLYENAYVKRTSVFVWVKPGNFLVENLSDLIKKVAAGLRVNMKD